MKIPQTTPSGAYVTLGNREMQLYAHIPKSDALVAVLEVNDDCPGDVHCYAMRGGIDEGRMTAAECENYGRALMELVALARATWPKNMRRASDDIRGQES
jgi:hypothetical protein